MRMRVASIAVLATVMLWIAAPASDAQPQPPRPGPPGGMGQLPRRPVRDPRQPPAEATGTATVRGRVVDGITGMPIARAKVRVGNTNPRTARVATTDAEGVFTLSKLQAGQVSLVAEKATYLQSTYPERRRTMRGTNITIGDGQTIDSVTIPLYRGGAITGRILDAYGDPLENVTVHVFAAPQTGGRSTSPRGGLRSSQSTNDIGEYRVGRLDPGQYYVMVTPESRRGNLNQEDAGSVPGRTWYPGVASFDQAQTVTIERGASVAGVDLQLLETTLTRVSGMVMTAKGGAAKSGHVSVRTTGASRTMPQGFGPGGNEMPGTGIDQYGNFDLMLQPGEYILEATTPQNDEGPRPQGRMEMDRGEARLTIGGDSMNVTITTGSGGTASGRFVFKGTKAPPTSFQGFNINFSGPSGGAMGNEDCRVWNRGTVNPDGTFLASNMWGTCQVRGNGNASGWTFQSVMHNGNDITSRVIEFGAGKSISGVEIIYTDRVGEIEATVADEGGQPTQDYVVLAFPAEKEKWGDQRFVRIQMVSVQQQQANAMAAGPTAGRVMANGVDPGAFALGGINQNAGNTLRTLLAGDYYVVALDDAAYEDIRDAEYLEKLSQMATRVSLSPGETQTVQLRRVKAPE